MKPSHRLRIWTVFFSVCALTALPGALSAQGGSGVVVGKVLDASGNALAGAEVSVVGTRLTSVTNEQGSYRISAVPAGTQTLAFHYVGYVATTMEAQIEGGATLTQDVILQPFGEEIIVRASPYLEGQAEALSRQKFAVNITNIVAADQIGRFPDPNAAEATQRIPAITLLRDQGEGRYVLVRGTEARLNSTTINGERIPSPEAGTRDIALDVIPADLLDSIEVSKALTPDMDGDAIGGTVDLVTKRAPEETRIAATLAGGYDELVEGSITNGNFTFGRRFDDKNTGLLLSGSSYVTERGSDNFEPEYDDGDLDEFQLRDYVLTRERYGATVSLDRRASDRSDLFLRGMWNSYQDDETRRAKRERVGDERVERVIRDRLQESLITSLTAGGSYQAGVSTVDYRVAWNRAGEETPNQITATFRQKDVEFDPNVSPDSIDPDNIRANPLNEDISESKFDALETEYKDATEEDVVGAVDFARAFYRDDGFSGRWKLGAKLRMKEKDQDVTVWAYESEDDLYLVDFLSGWRSETPFLGGRYDIGPFHSPGSMRNLLAGGSLEGERILEEDLADFNSTEDTLAAYGMVELELGAKTTFLGGVRVENTETDYSAFELAFDEEGDPTDLMPVSGGSDYTELLPMVHLKVRLDDNSNLRAAVTRTLARPNFESLAPFQLTNFEDEEIVRGNPDLEVTTSWNLDLLWERYLEPLGIISAGVFYKELDNNIFLSTFDQEINGVEFEVEQPLNGQGADLRGFEVAYQNRIRKAGSPWDGLGLYFNYTFVESEADYPDRPSTRLQGQAEDVGNLAVSYERFGFSGRVSLNYSDKYLLEIGGGPEEDIWIDSHFQVDFSARQQITERMSLFLEAINLGDEPYRVYEGSSDRPRQEEYYSWWGMFGIRFDF